MVGGSDADVERALPVFDALRPEGERADGFVHAGPVGAGHYAKMVHNGIEYGLMQAYAEGYELLEAEDLVTDVHGVLRAWTKARSSGRGCWSCSSRHWVRIPISPRSPVTQTIPVRDAGRCSRRSTTRCPRR